MSQDVIDKESAILPGDLWALAGKLRGLGELFSMAMGEPPTSSDGFKGISIILLEMADEADHIVSALQKHRLL